MDWAVTCSSHDCASRLASTTVHEDLVALVPRKLSTEPIPVRNREEPMVGGGVVSRLPTRNENVPHVIEDSQPLLRSFDEFQRLFQLDPVEHLVRLLWPSSESSGAPGTRVQNPLPTLPFQ